VTDTDLTNVEQPDELIQRAWNAGFDKKAVIREGVNAAGLLLAGERNEMVTLFWPAPRPLEAVDLWSENPYPDPATTEKLRPFASAVIPGCVVGAVVTHFFVAPRMSEDSGLTALVWVIVASIAVIGVLFKVLIAATLRRRAARLDEETAFGIMLDQLRLGMTVNPQLVPRACVWIRRGVDRIAGTPR
jgi:hypothetical protein